MTDWIEPEPVVIPTDLQAVVDAYPLTLEILARRGYTDPSRAVAFLDPNAYHPASGLDFPGMQTACERIEKAIHTGERIWVWGDFDVDGQTSTAVLVETLRLLGGDPRYHIPIRANESHGVNLPNLRRIFAAGADLLVTCDTGITAHEALEWAHKNALEVIVTDHHALGATLPPALAHITPRLLSSGHPLETLPGVGVAYMLSETLLLRAGMGEKAADLLDLVALGIVADVAVQNDGARYLLQRGLDQLRRTERLGLRAMFTTAEIQPAWLNEEHIGFVIAPRLNALGRLSNANPAVEFFTTRDVGRAAELAQELEALNAQRQLLTGQVLDAARHQIERDPALLQAPVLILNHPEWPAGVIGIVASHLVERYNRPVILLSAPPGENARGSARSVEGIDITACIAEQSNLLASYGGHPMAAGLSLPAENLPALRSGMIRSVRAALERSGVQPSGAESSDTERPGSEGGIPQQELSIDAWFDPAEATLDLAEDLGRLGPFGPGNPPLVLAARGFRWVDAKPLGRRAERSEHLLVSVEDRQGRRHNLYWWGGANWPTPEGSFDLAFTLRASNYRGQRTLSLEWIGYRPLQERTLELQGSRFEVTDHRQVPHPRPLLDAILNAGGAALWTEGEARRLLNGQDRTALTPAETLVIWTQPPARAVMQAVLDLVKPRCLVLFALPPGDETPERFLIRLAGLVKFELNRSDGAVVIPLRRLAAGCAQTETAARLGLQWLAGNGQITLDFDADGNACLAVGLGQRQTDLTTLEIRIRDLLTESAAYREYYSTAPVDSLLA